jgi:hypothetical protein
MVLRDDFIKGIAVVPRAMLPKVTAKCALRLEEILIVDQHGREIRGPLNTRSNGTGDRARRLNGGEIPG